MAGVAVATVAGLALPAGANTGHVSASQSCSDGWRVTVTLDNNVTSDHDVVVTSTIPNTQGLTGNFDTTHNSGTQQIWSANGPAVASGTVTLTIWNPGHKTIDSSAQASLPSRARVPPDDHHDLGDDHHDLPDEHDVPGDHHHVRHHHHPGADNDRGSDDHPGADHDRGSDDHPGADHDRGSDDHRLLPADEHDPGRRHDGRSHDDAADAQDHDDGQGAGKHGSDDSSSDDLEHAAGADHPALHR